MAIRLLSSCVFRSCRRESVFPVEMGLIFRNTTVTQSATKLAFLSSIHSQLSHRNFSESVKSLPKKRGPGEGRGPITWKTVGLTLAIGSVFTAAMLYFKKEKELKIEKDRTRSLGKANLGGQWELVDHTGQLRKSSDYHGQWLLLYFGFTHCPDICPDEIEKLCKAVDIVDDDKECPNVQPVFITVDPVRDTVAAVATYIKEFSSKIIGFTGTVDQVAKAAKAYRVYFSQGPKDGDEDYIVDHTIITYLVDPNGNFVDFYGQNKGAEEISNSIRVHMMKFKQLYK